MRQGGFELLLECEDKVLSEHEVGDKLYAAAETGKAYKVKLNIYRNRNGLFPCDYIRVGVYIDGYDVKDWRRITLPSDNGSSPNDKQMMTVEFSGFFTGEQGTRAFSFGPLGRKVGADQDDNETLFGSIRVLVFEAFISDIIHERQPFMGIRHLPEIRCVEETRKFWQTASVTTVAGDLIPGTERNLSFNPPRPGDRPQYKWRNAQKEPLVEMTLHYHTSDMLRFLKGFLEQEEQQRNDHRMRVQNGQHQQHQNGGGGGGGGGGGQQCQQQQGEYQYYTPQGQGDNCQDDQEVQFVDQPPSHSQNRSRGQVHQLY
eukprot:gene21268-27291_t